MIIAKFGGTSVSTKERFETICQIVLKEKERQPVVVVSAIRGITDLLLASVDASSQERKSIFNQIEKMHMDLVRAFWKKQDVTDIEIYLKKCLQQLEHLLTKKERSKALSDEIVSFGEMLSSYVISKALETKGFRSQQVVATELIVTNVEFGAAEFLPKETVQKSKKVIMPLIEKGIIPVVTGFIGSTKDGRITTLGRGGSDYSAAVLGFALQAEEIQIWTDVDGIFTTDPRYFKDAFVLSHVSYKEASELASFGGKVLHPRTIRPAIHAGIPVRVLNTLNPAFQGTLITEKPLQTSHIAAIASKRKITLVNLYSTEMLFSKGFLARVFTVFAKHNISVDLVSVSEVSVSVTLDNDENLKDATCELEKFTAVTTDDKYGMVSLIGDGIVSVKNIMRNIFSILEQFHIEVKMISLGATDINISLVIPTVQVDEAVSVLHRTMVVRKGYI